MTEKAIWVTIEEPLDESEYEQIAQAFENTDLSDRYEIILTDESIDTIDMDDLRELIDND